MSKPSGAGRRTLKDIEEWLTASEVYKLIKAKTWPYKTDIEYYVERDLALMAIDFVGAFRNNEPLRNLRKANFVDGGGWLVLRAGKISKRSKKLVAKYGSRVTTREDIRFPKFEHPLQPFTDLVLDYLMIMPSEETVLFQFGERRHHQIVSCVTGMWVHWLRSMGENWYGHNVFRNDPVSLAKFLGVVNVQSVMPYTGFDEESYIERMKKSSLQDRK